MRHTKDCYVTKMKGSPDYYYVRAVPKDLQKAIGKTKWSIPLGTTNKGRALQKAYAIAAKHNALIDRLRRPDPLEEMSPAERKRVEDAGGVEAFMTRERARWQGANLAANVAEMTRKYPPEGGDPAFAESEALAFEATARALDAAVVADAPILSQFGVNLPPRLRGPGGEATVGEPKTMQELCERYLSIRSPRYEGAYRLVVKQFDEVNGKLLLRNYESKHVREYRDWLPKTGNAENTSNGYFKKLRAMLTFAHENIFINEDIGKPIKWEWPYKQSIAEAEDNKRRTFSIEESGRYLKAAESLPLDNRTRWFILLMMYSGARGEELAQMSSDDIIKVGGIPCMDIHDKEWRTLKHEGCRRRVPLHNIVLEKGFLDFVAARKGKQLIFSDRLAVKKTKCYPRNAEGVREVLRKSALINDPRVVPYSSRHTFIDCLRAVEAPKFQEDMIVGHKSAANKVSYEYGSAQIRIMKKWVDRVDPMASGRNTTLYEEDEDD